MICGIIIIILYMRYKTKIKINQQNKDAEKSHDHYDYKKHELEDKKDQRRVGEVLLTTAREKLEEEKSRTTPDKELIDEWEVYLKDIFKNMKKMMGEGEASRTVEPEGAGIREDGGFREDMEITGIKGIYVLWLLLPANCLTLSGEAHPTIEPEGPGIREDGGKFKEDIEITKFEGMYF